MRKALFDVFICLHWNYPRLILYVNNSSQMLPMYKNKHETTDQKMLVILAILLKVCPAHTWMKMHWIWKIREKLNSARLRWIVC